MKKMRLDELLVNLGLADSRDLAGRYVMAGQVRINGQVAQQPGDLALPDAEVTLDLGPRFVSRGGEKLAAAFEAFALDVRGHVCADVGASTGGFTDCLLQHGAARVYAIDVGGGILHWKLRQDERVVVMENTNAREVSLLPERVAFVSVDASFISLRVLLPVISGWFSEKGQAVALIKPQFEAERAETDEGRGVIEKPAVHRRVLEEVLSSAFDRGYTLGGVARSPIIGPKGNQEFLAWFFWGQRSGKPVAPMIDALFS
jgi:23S rRNA (cytidine1920-2'-O)/16S rRNA (cytidine1409-2'-O)-methyltransferase